ncbi:PAS domain S-box protein [Silvibacterium acidisoli]|uniref:PAS domain S-box protein n=1 Tax=Acidobacteriaceae bacterium ZG23-2 TaxID=2883246 RepID=UPI00406CFB2F
MTLPSSTRTQISFYVAALLFVLGGAAVLAWCAERHHIGLLPIGCFVTCWLLAILLLFLAGLFHIRSYFLRRRQDQAISQVLPVQQSILSSDGTLLITTNLEGDITTFNAGAELLLGYTADEVLGRIALRQMFAEGEGQRIGRTLLASQQPAGLSPSIFDLCLSYLRDFPSGRARPLEMNFRNRNGWTFPATVHLTVIEDEDGELSGLLLLGTDLSSARRVDDLLHESEERYQDLFENAVEMIATMNEQGNYLYVNPAWEELFGISSEGFETLMSFESAFPPEVQAEVAALFRRALLGERVERESLQLRNPHGGRVEVEASLSSRRSANRPATVRCILRDVTQRNRRERRMGMQLEVSQIVGESTSREEALPKVLAALCNTLGYDMANLWVVDDTLQQIRFDCSWSVPDRNHDEFLRDTQSRVFTRGEGMPGMVWALGAPRWSADLRNDPSFTRRHSARLTGLNSGLAVPVRVGNRVIAAVEFYSRQRRDEDPETMSSVETVCASIGQFMARSAQEMRVRELHQQNEFILNSVADGIFGADPEGRVDFVNPAAAAMLGASPAELAGRPVHSILHSGASPEACGEQCRTRRAFLLHETTSGQDVFYRLDGRPFPVEFSVTPMLEHGTAIGSVLSFRDISERYALDRMKDEFISTVSHELRTPLTSIRGALGLLSSGLLGEISEKAGNLMRIALSNSDRLVRLINDILDLERMQSGRAPLNFREISLDDLAKQVVEAVQPMADAASIRLALHAVPTQSEVDPDRIQQVITNLLSNAIKFSPPEATVTVEVGPTRDGAMLSVIDNGRGIPTDKLETIFDRFQQVDASDSRQKGGTGLGLAICRTILQQHGGRIWAEHNPAGSGAAFRVFLPERTRLDSLQESPNEDEAVHQDTLLICEAGTEARTALVAALRRQRFRVLEAENSTQTLHLAQHFPVNTILLGISRQVKQNYSALQLLKADAATISIPVILLNIGAEAGLPAEEDDLTAYAALAGALREGNAQSYTLLVEPGQQRAIATTATFRMAGTQIHHASNLSQAVEFCQSARRPDLVLLNLGLPGKQSFDFIEWLDNRGELSSLPMIVYSNAGSAERMKEIESLAATLLRRHENADPA